MKSHLEKVHSSFPVVCLSKYIVEHNEKVRIGDSPDEKFRILGVTNKIGVFHAYDAFGRDINQPYKRVSARDFTYNPYRVNVGSVGMVPPDLDKGYISPAYVVFSVASENLLPEFLELVLPSHWYNPVLRAATAGSVRQNLTYDLLGSLEIPVPPLSIQRAIVARWRAAQEAVHKANERTARIEKEIAARFLSDLGLSLPDRAAPPKAFALKWQHIERWSVMFNQLASVGIDISTGKYPVTTLGEIAAVSYGIQKCPANRAGQHARPYLRVANVQRGELDLREIKYIDVPDSEMPGLRLEPSDLLVCEGNSAELVGRPAMWRGEIPDCVHQNHILKARLNPTNASPEYVLQYMSSSPARNHFRARAKFTTNLASINSNDLRELPVVLPPLEVQRAIMKRVEAGRAEIAREREAAQGIDRRTQTEVEEMILGTRPVK